MNWEQLERTLASAFTATPQRIGDSVLVQRPRPLGLETVLEDTLADDPDGWSGSVSEFLDEHDARVELLDFYWESLGPMSWLAGMDLVGTGRRRYLAAWDEVTGYRLLTAIEPADDAVAVCAAVAAYLAVNGRDHEDGLFGSLPHEVTNHRPDLLPTESVKQTLFDYMQWAESVDPGAWALLAEEHFGRIVEPNHLQRSLDVLETMVSIDLDAIEADSAAMPDVERQRLFDEWFAVAYRSR